jgi:2-iminobutanoate/2-iminopropanoate deaminase
MREIISTKQAPKAIGPYSQGRMAGNYLFSSGQSPIDPVSGSLVAGGITAQTIQVMENLKQILLAAELSFDDVVKTMVFITDMADFAAVNEIYARYFGDKLPARSCLAVVALPKAALVEIELVAYNSQR